MAGAQDLIQCVKNRGYEDERWLLFYPDLARALGTAIAPDYGSYANMVKTMESFETNHAMYVQGDNTKTQQVVQCVDSFR